MHAAAKHRMAVVHVVNRGTLPSSFVWHGEFLLDCLGCQCHFVRSFSLADFDVQVASASSLPPSTSVKFLQLLMVQSHGMSTYCGAASRLTVISAGWEMMHGSCKQQYGRLTMDTCIAMLIVTASSGHDSIDVTGAGRQLPQPVTPRPDSL